ncbi:MAG: hypothetical protein COA63_010790 [Methylophaga sp.]|nr:hypothetical protein [Methylophaga sp.]
MTDTNLPQTTIEDDQANSGLVMQIIGRVQMGNAMSNFLATVSTLEMRKVKESKAYRALKGHSLPDKHGNKIANVSTWAGFCRACGLTDKKVDEDIRNLNTFGEQALELMQHAGIGIREMRRLRQLPEEELIRLENKVINAKDTVEVVDVIEDLVATNQEQQRLNGDLKADNVSQNHQLDVLEVENEQLRDQLKAQSVNSWPQYTNMIRMESSALGDKAVMAIDELERLLVKVEQPELDIDDPERVAHYSAAVISYWTNLRFIQARISRLIPIVHDSLSEAIDEAPEALGMASMEPEEIIRLTNNRNLLVHEFERDALAREARRMNNKPKRRRSKKAKAE